MYVADDVRWDMPGIFAHVRKDAFRTEIKNDAFDDPPEIKIKAEIEEGDYVAVEGEVQCRKRTEACLMRFFSISIN